MSQDQTTSQPTKLKELLFSEEARTKILKGMNIVADAVSATLGPMGRNVVIERSRNVGLMQNRQGLMPRITKDGVSVAREINLEDKFENLGAQIMKEVAVKQNDRAGDGTTTATVLASTLANNVFSAIDAAPDMSPVKIKKKFEEYLEWTLTELDALATPVDGNKDILEAVATISANGDEEVGSIVSEVVSEVGKDGIVAIEPSAQAGVKVNMVAGMEFPAGYAGYYQFINKPEKGLVEFKDAFIFMYDDKIMDIKEILPVMSTANNADKPLVIICKGMPDDIMSTIILNKIKNGFQVCVLKVPEYVPHRDMLLEDLAMTLGTTVITPHSGVSISSMTEDTLGYAKQVRISEKLSEFIDGRKDETRVYDTVSQLVTSLENMDSSSDEYEFTKGRLAKLTNSIALIQVGGSSQLDVGERADRIEDAVNACKAALEEGVFAGGGTVLLCLSGDFQEKYGQDVIANAFYYMMRSPFETIIRNAGIFDVENSFENYGKVFNPMTETFVDPFESGILDPVKVTKNALKDAVALVGLVLTTDVAIVEKEID